MEPSTLNHLTPPKKKPVVGYVILIFVGMILIGTCSSIFDGDKPKEKKQKVELTREQDSLLTAIEFDGHIEIKPFDNEVYVKPLFWLTCNYKAKENLAYFCAIRCENANDNGLYYCTVKDMQSGKKLAKYSQAWGFDVEE